MHDSARILWLRPQNIHGALNANYLILHKRENRGRFVVQRFTWKKSLKKQTNAWAVEMVILSSDLIKATPARPLELVESVFTCCWWVAPQNGMEFPVYKKKTLYQRYPSRDTMQTWTGFGLPETSSDALRVAHTWYIVQGCVVHLGIKTVGREPRWWRLNSEHHKVLAPFFLPS